MIRLMLLKVFIHTTYGIQDLCSQLQTAGFYKQTLKNQSHVGILKKGNLPALYSLQFTLPCR